MFGGKLIVCQEQKGYRFSLDAVLLAGLTRIDKNDRVLELGTGCGIISLILAYRAKTERKIAAVEIQPELAELARKNVEQNHFGDTIEVHRLDFREGAGVLAAGSFDLVLSNPPYRKPGAGRVNPDRQKALARHELTATVTDVFEAARRLVPTGGRVAVVYPATRLGHLFCTAFDQGFTPKRLTVIHSFPGEPGRLVHLECRKGGGEELRIEKPFSIYDAPDRYSEAMRELYGEGG
ncbi:MAG: methyltransferase [Syntrophobacteraceae bacterium]|nr:methyltransferase [Syntrophobacteraceae bacterium]